ncbi:MAG: hypothetical protein GTO14_14360 [Anaerolineales bacterium]|nr:hypothetical protein [Anaerolineales bacterium]
MNRIRTGRMILAGLVTLLVFILVEIVWESLIGVTLFPRMFNVSREALGLKEWNLVSFSINIGVAALNSVMMIWLYAALRPMFGVGPRNALITSGFIFAFILAFSINNVNMGFIPMFIAGFDILSLVVELPIAIIAGAAFYEAG